jgi:hypothetical protein
MHADGSYHWFRLRGAAQRESGRRGHRVVVTVADVSVSKRLEEVDGAERELLALIAASVPLPDVMSRLAILVEQTLNEHSRAAVFVFDPTHPEQVEVAAPGLSAAFHASAAVASRQLIESVLANAPRGLRPVLFDDLEQTEGFVPLRELMQAEAMHSLWMLPLVGYGNVLMGCLVDLSPAPVASRAHRRQSGRTSGRYCAARARTRPHRTSGQGAARVARATRGRAHRAAGTGQQ